MAAADSKRPLIILFAKAPVPGKVKTRLQPPLSALEAARLQIAFVNDMLEMLLGELGFADIELHVDEPTGAWTHHHVPQKLQADGDLGVKLLHALGSALADGR